MNILFIIPLNAPYDTIIGAEISASDTKLRIRDHIKCMYPSGILCICAYIQKYISNINIKIIDLNVILTQLNLSKIEDSNQYKLEDLIREALSMVDGFTPDIIGISAFFANVYRDLKPIASFLRNRYCDSLIVCGGHTATALYDRIYEDDLVIDAVCFGEGEIPTLELIRAILFGNKEEYLSSSPCWITKKKIRSEKKFIPQHNAIVNLDEIPPYDLNTLLFPNAYFNPPHSFFRIESEKPRIMFMFVTRGCPYRCIFCASHSVHGRKVRYYSVDRIKKAILYYNKQYNITKFLFYDDHFMSKKDQAIEILKFISEQNFIAEIATPAFSSIDADVVSAMKCAGIQSVNITIESGNEDTLKNIIHKSAGLQKAEEVVDLLRAAGMIVMTNILIGFPGETKESIDEGLEYLLTTNFNWFSCLIATPLPGSQLYKICKENGYFISNDDILSMNFTKCIIKTKDFTPEYIERKVYEMNLKLNFVNNYDFRTGNYKMALFLFEKVINSVIDTHAFAYYFAAKCCAKLSLDEKYQLYKAKYEEIVAKDPFWRDWVDKLLSD